MPQVVAGAIAGALGITSATGIALVQIGTSLVLSAAAKALQPKPDTGALKGRTQTIRQPVMPRDLVVGRVRKGGTMIYAHLHSGKKILEMIVVFSTNQVEDIEDIYFDGRKAFDAGSSSPVGRYQKNGKDYATVWRHDGNPSVAAFPELRSVPNSKWTSSHRLAGCAAIRLSLEWDPDMYPTGIPNVTAVIQGANQVYDPRTMTTGYSRNSALNLAWYMAHPQFGLGATIGAVDGINEDELIASANICEETVPNVGGGTEKRYTCNGVITLDQPPQTIIQAMLTAMAGDAVCRGGEWSLLAGAWRPPVLTFGQDDIIGDGFTLQTRQPASDNFNAVRGQFISPNNDWQPDDFPAYESAVYLAEDNGERSYADISLPFTTRPSEAQRLAKIHLEKKRRQMSVSMQGRLSTLQATVGDVVNLDYARWGFSAKPFEVRGMSIAIEGGEDAPPVLTIAHTLRETSALIYDWSSSEGQIYADAPLTDLPDPFEPGPPTALTVTEGLYQARGILKVEVNLSWVAPDEPFIDEYQIEASSDGGLTWILGGRTDQTSFRWPDFQTGDWEFRVKMINSLGVSSSYGQVAATILGLNQAPSALQNLTLQTAGGMAILKWKLSTDLDVVNGGTIEIRHSTAGVPAWNNSVSMDIVSGSQSNAPEPLLPGTYLLRAVDAGGTAGPVATVSTAGAQAIAFSSLGSLTEDTAFSGTHSGTLAISGQLRLGSGSTIDSWPDFDAIADIDAEGGLLLSGTYEFAAGLDLGSVKLVRLRQQILMSIYDLTTTIDDRGGDIDDWASFDGAEGAEVDVVVEVSLTDDDPAGSPTWGVWTRVDSTEVSCRGIRARALLSTTDSNFSPLVSELRLYADEVTP